MNWTELWGKGSTPECLGYSEALWFFDGLPLLPSHPISFSQCYQVTVFFQGLMRAFYVRAKDNQKISYERSDGWENMKSIPALRRAATAWESFAEDSNQQKDGINDSNDSIDLLPLETREKGLATLLKVVLSGDYSVLGHTVCENLRTETIFHLITLSTIYQPYLTTI